MPHWSKFISSLHLVPSFCRSVSHLPFLGLVLFPLFAIWNSLIKFTQKKMPLSLDFIVLSICPPYFPQSLFVLPFPMGGFPHRSYFSAFPSRFLFLPLFMFSPSSISSSSIASTCAFLYCFSTSPFLQALVVYQLFWYEFVLTWFCLHVWLCSMCMHISCFILYQTKKYISALLFLCSVFFLKLLALKPCWKLHLLESWLAQNGANINAKENKLTLM